MNFYSCPRLPRLQKANPYSLQSIKYLDELFSHVQGFQDCKRQIHILCNQYHDAHKSINFWEQRCSEPFFLGCTYMALLKFSSMDLDTSNNCRFHFFDLWPINKCIFVHHCTQEGAAWYRTTESWYRVMRQGCGGDAASTILGHGHVKTAL